MNYKKEVIEMSKMKRQNTCEICLFHKISTSIISSIKIRENLGEELLDSLKEEYDFNSCLIFYLWVLIKIFPKEKAISVFKNSLDDNFSSFPCEKIQNIFQYIVNNFGGLKLE